MKRWYNQRIVQAEKYSWIINIPFCNDFFFLHMYAYDIFNYLLSNSKDISSLLNQEWHPIALSKKQNVYFSSLWKKIARKLKLKRNTKRFYDFAYIFLLLIRVIECNTDLIICHPVNRKSKYPLEYSIYVSIFQNFHSGCSMTHKFHLRGWNNINTSQIYSLLFFTFETHIHPCIRYYLILYTKSNQNSPSLLPLRVSYLLHIRINWMDQLSWIYPEVKLKRTPVWNHSLHPAVAYPMHPMKRWQLYYSSQFSFNTLYFHSI